jgi:hypothetical protein
VGREALESSSAVLQTAATPSQLPAQTKRPDISRHPALKGSPAKEDADVTSAMDTPLAKPVARRRYWASVRISKVISSCSLLPQSAVNRFPNVVVHMGDEEEMQLVRDYSANLLKFDKTPVHP